jgi:hypothetical protein
VNAEQLLAFDKILITGAALEQIALRTTRPAPNASGPPGTKAKARGSRKSEKTSEDEAGK